MAAALAWRFNGNNGGAHGSADLVGLILAYVALSFSFGILPLSYVPRLQFCFPAVERHCFICSVSFILDVTVNSVAVGFSLKARSVFAIQSTGQKSSPCVKL